MGARCGGCACALGAAWCAGQVQRAGVQHSASNINVHVFDKNCHTVDALKSTAVRTIRPEAARIRPAAVRIAQVRGLQIDSLLSEYTTSVYKTRYPTPIRALAEPDQPRRKDAAQSRI